MEAQKVCWKWIPPSSLRRAKMSEIFQFYTFLNIVSKWERLQFLYIEVPDVRLLNCNTFSHGMYSSAWVFWTNSQSSKVTVFQEYPQWFHLSAILNNKKRFTYDKIFQTAMITFFFLLSIFFSIASHSHGATTASVNCQSFCLLISKDTYTRDLGSLPRNLQIGKFFRDLHLLLSFMKFCSEQNLGNIIDS